MKIGGFDLDEKVLVIAEIGNNHEGDFGRAVDLVHRAREAGADAVKFQTFRTSSFANPRDRDRYQRLRSFELPFERFADLAHLARELGLLFLSTPLDLDSARFLAGIVDALKIASGDNDFRPLLDQVAGSGLPLLLSSGLTDGEAIKGACRFVHQAWQEHGVQAELAVLHCVTSYPVPPDQAELAAIPFLRHLLGETIGYSDHTLGIDAAAAAVALGARLVEKHFTLDKQQSDFRDHALSADPAEMRRMVDQIRRVELLLGRRQKVIQPCESSFLLAARRSIVAAADLPQGRTLDLADLTWMRPAGGLKPGEEHQVVGRTLKRSLEHGEPVLPADLE